MKDCYEKINPNLLVFILVALLSGARNEKNIHLSEKVYDRMKKLFPESTNSMISAVVLLANAYASSGESEKSSNIRTQLHQSGAKKKLDLSWTAINGQLFVSLEL
jgi:hypothetical protein